MEITLKIEAAELGPLVRLVASVLGNGPRGQESEPGLGQPSKPASK